MSSIIKEAVDETTIQTIDFVLRLLDKYPVNMVVKELTEYKQKLEEGLEENV